MGKIHPLKKLVIFLPKSKNYRTEFFCNFFQFVSQQFNRFLILPSFSFVTILLSLTDPSSCYSHQSWFYISQQLTYPLSFFTLLPHKIQVTFNLTNNFCPGFISVPPITNIAADTSQKNQALFLPISFSSLFILTHLLFSPQEPKSLSVPVHVLLFQSSFLGV